MSDDPNAKCETCDNTWAWHQENKPQHPFNSGDMPASATFGKRRTDGQGNVPTEVTQPQLSPWPFDPVLRQALVNKGVITPDDLANAEHQIRAVTATLGSGVANLTATIRTGQTHSYVVGGDDGPVTTT